MRVNGNTYIKLEVWKHSKYILRIFMKQYNLYKNVNDSCQK